MLSQGSQYGAVPVESDKTEQKPISNIHYIAPLFVLSTGALSIASYLHSQYPKEGITLPIIIGGLVGVVNSKLTYHVVTLPASQQHNTIIMQEKTPIDCQDQFKAAVILFSSGCYGTIEALKLTLSTGGNRVLPLMIGYTSYSARFYAQGAKCFSDAGKNINDTYAGTLCRITLLDHRWVTRYVFDTKATATAAYPIVEGISQIFTVFNIIKLLGFSNFYGLLATGLLASYFQYHSHESYNQKIMAHSIRLSHRNHVYLAWLIDNLVIYPAAVVADAGLSLLGDMLSIVISPMWCMKLSTLLVGVLNGGAIFVGIGEKFNLPLNWKGYSLGASGAILDAIATRSRFLSSFNNTIVDPEEQKKQIIGLKKTMIERFGEEEFAEPNESETCGMRINRRRQRYCEYVSHRLADTANSIYGFFRTVTACHEIVDESTPEEKQSLTAVISR